eukprot:SAG31_NODE_20523_length_572_cov_0.832981_2_plen_33_part_01
MEQSARKWADHMGVCIARTASFARGVDECLVQY